jgi:hypothetical protein
MWKPPWNKPLKDEIMNKAQRKRIDNEILGPLSGLNEAEHLEGMTREEVEAILDPAYGHLEDVIAEERDKFDNMSEGLQAGPTGEKIDQIASELEGVLWPSVDGDLNDEEYREQLASEIQDVMDEIDNAVNQ